MSKWIKKGDKVIVIAGNEKGKTGEVLVRKEDRVVIQGVNIRKKHVKRRTRTAHSEIMEIEAPLHISNVSLCNQEGSPIKVKVRFTEDGNKELYYLDGKKEVVHRKI
jgi:large subunit ribosomal protein L24